MEAEVSNAPIRRKPKPLHSEDISQIQPPEIVLPATGRIDRGEEIEPIDAPLLNGHTQALLMAEEPITIIIEPSQDENAPTVVDCWVNGKGAEVMDTRTNRWMEINCLPIGGPITTKRKYVEVLARSKRDKVTTKVGSSNEESPENRVVRNTSRTAVFTVLHDANPMGREWLTRLLSER